MGDGVDMRLAAKLLGITIAMLAMWIGVSWAKDFHEKTQAHDLLSLVENIKVGESGQSDFPELEKQFGNFMDIDKSLGESDSAQEHLFTFNNHAMAAIHVAPLRAVNIGLTYRNGIVVAKTVQFVEYDRCALAVEDFGSELPPGLRAHEGAGRHVYLSRDAKSRVVSVVIRDSGMVPESQRQLDWNLNLGRLALFGSRSNASDTYPGLFCAAK